MDLFIKQVLLFLIKNKILIINIPSYLYRPIVYHMIGYLSVENIFFCHLIYREKNYILYIKS